MTRVIVFEKAGNRYTKKIFDSKESAIVYRMLSACMLQAYKPYWKADKAIKRRIDRKTAFSGFMEEITVYTVYSDGKKTKTVFTVPAMY